MPSSERNRMLRVNVFSNTFHEQHFRTNTSGRKIKENCQTFVSNGTFFIEQVQAI